MVGADAHADAQLLGTLDQRREDALDSLQLGAVLGVGVLANREFLLVGVVAGVDADLVDVLDRPHGCGRREVDVRHQRDPDPAALQLGADIGQVLGVAGRRHGQANDLATGLDQPHGLFDGCRRVLGRLPAVAGPLVE